MRSVIIACFFAAALAVDDDLSLLQTRAALSPEEEDEAVAQAVRITAADVQNSDEDESEDDDDEDDEVDDNMMQMAMTKLGKCNAAKCYKKNGNIKLNSCSKKKCRDCTECPTTTTTTTPAPTPNPTPYPTPNPTPSPTPPVVNHGDVVYVKNMYDQQSWLDSCGGGVSCASTSTYRVSTSSQMDRDGVGTGRWQIRKVNGHSGNINHGDVVYIINQYSTPTFLDTCGGGSCTSGTQWGVSTNSGSRGSTSEWQVLKSSGGPVYYGETLTLKNMYSGGQGYLDSCGGASCASSTKWGVYTNTGVRGSTSQWQFVAR
jgi:hypothetical protein